MKMKIKATIKNDKIHFDKMETASIIVKDIRSI